MAVTRTRRLTTLVAVPAAVVLAASSPSLAGDSHTAHATDQGQSYQINLEQMNDTGAQGTAFVTVDGTRLSVKIEASGLVPGQPHAQHIHGSTDGHDFHCPDDSADKNGDGIVTTAEGLPAYGDINISLTTRGDTSKKSGLAVERMPKADSAGKLSYSRTITVSQKVADHIKDLHVVQHGIDANNNGTYDFGKGKSELDPKLPQEATAPAACGMVKGAAVGSMPVGGVETGSGTTKGMEAPGMVAAGGAALLGAGALFALRRRAQGDARRTR
ncbi:CHRD domain-containing protein [Streptomyces aureocirculatus]|uniref:CHRD domain-containing protein n=1 Tax=Streptomyces aureocirculatus TaxID=67275 RepID=UPI0004CAD8E0|nr:CHRD domain-containing protein [Streptomyces aureocirculatus]